MVKMQPLGEPADNSCRDADTAMTDGQQLPSFAVAAAAGGGNGGAAASNGTVLNQRDPRRRLLSAFPAGNSSCQCGFGGCIVSGSFCGMCKQSHGPTDGEGLDLEAPAPSPAGAAATPEPAAAPAAVRQPTSLTGSKRGTDSAPAAAAGQDPASPISKRHCSLQVIQQQPDKAPALAAGSGDGAAGPSPWGRRAPTPTPPPAPAGAAAASGGDGLDLSKLAIGKHRAIVTAKLDTQDPIAWVTGTEIHKFKHMLDMCMG